MDRGFFAWGAVAALVLTSALGAILALPDAPAGTVTIWEAYARGWATITQIDITYDRGEQTVTYPVGFLVRNTGTVDIAVEDMAMLMSPSPSEFGRDPSDPTAQDGALTTGGIPAGGAVTYYYAEENLQGYLPSPVWWCTEQYQFTRANVGVALGGEILPPVLRELVATPYFDSPTQNTQQDLWNHLKSYPTVVVGKTPLWSEIAGSAGQVIPVTVTATNLAVEDDEDAFFGEVDAIGTVVIDRVPTGWSIVPGSFSTAPTSITDHPDGSKTLEWVVDIDAAEVTGRETAADFSEPSPYDGAKFRYKLESPRQPAGRIYLPPAEADLDADDEVDAYSATPIIDVYRVNTVPTAVAGGPYAGVEGTEIRFDGTASFDPDGDVLQYRWDIDGDGTWDTGWDASPMSPAVVFGDDTTGLLTLEVTDGELSATATAAYVIANAPPVAVLYLSASQGPEGGLDELRVDFEDPGWLDTHTAFVDWGTGEMETFPVESSHDPPRARGSFTVTHTYYDDFTYPVLWAVTDDDLGVESKVTPFDIVNVDPTLVDVDATVSATFGLRVAGEKWHDVTLMIMSDGAAVGSASIVRMPGSPDEQMVWLGDVDVDITSDFQATIVYTPEDDPLNGNGNGDNPAWLVLQFPDGTEVRLHHNFNGRHPSTWTWTVGDLLPLFTGQEVSLGARARDPGSDDLTFLWEFGDGTTASSTSYNNGASPDARPSPDGTAPFEAVSTAAHAYSSPGTYLLSLRVTDDDGGVTQVLIPIRI